MNEFEKIKDEYEFRDTDEGEGPYKGFLVIKCEECGRTKAFCAKRDLYAYRCSDCGHITVLENMRPLFAVCKCGETFRYKTNLEDDSYSMNCIRCGAKIDVRLNRRQTAYITPGKTKQIPKDNAGENN